MADNPNKPDRALIRLLRFIGRNTARVTETGGSLDIRIDNAPQPLTITSSLLAKAISMGLLRQEADRLSCEHTVSAYLKRAMVRTATRFSRSSIASPSLSLLKWMARGKRCGAMSYPRRFWRWRV